MCEEYGAFDQWWRLLFILLNLPEKTYQSKEIYLSILSSLNTCIELKIKIFYHYIAMSLKSFILFLVTVIPSIRLETAKLFRCLPLEMDDDKLEECLKSLMIWNISKVDECNGYILGMSYLIGGLNDYQFLHFNDIVKTICINIYNLLFDDNHNNTAFIPSLIQAITTISKCHVFLLTNDGEITRIKLYSKLYKLLENKPNNDIIKLTFSCLESLSYYETNVENSKNTINTVFSLVDNYGEDIQYNLGESLSIIATKNNLQLYLYNQILDTLLKSTKPHERRAASIFLYFLINDNTEKDIFKDYIFELHTAFTSLLGEKNPITQVFILIIKNIFVSRNVQAKV